MSTATQEHCLKHTLYRCVEMRLRTVVGALLISISLLAVAGCNPFAPKLEELKLDRNKLLGDRRSVRGFFDWFRNSYELRDTSLYGQILAPDFIFSTRDFSNGNNLVWDRDQEMRITTNMFRQIRSANLVWSWFSRVDTASSDTIARVERYFNLTIVLDDQNIYNGTGTALLTLTRQDSTMPWRARSWVDIRDF
jgi:hypothetical protein